jgi:heme-degrading monooxygenase HmoA
MFSVIFEVHPRPEQWDAYLGAAKSLRPELEQVDGFVDNIRYKSLTREGWILSLSGWRDEKAVVRWRTQMHHHDVQARGRSEILLDYHLRVGQVTQDTHVPSGHTLIERRLDETQVGAGTTITLIDAKGLGAQGEAANATKRAQGLGLDPNAAGLVGWDVFDAVLAPGDLILMLTWRTVAEAAAFEAAVQLPPGGRLRQVRVVRDYGMFDRREAPQYYPAAVETY